MKRELSWTAVLTAALCCSCSPTAPAPPPAGPVKVELPRAEKWEYKEVYRSEMENRMSNVKNLLFQTELNQHGDRGWELVGVQHVVVPLGKRARSTRSSPTSSGPRGDRG